MIDEPIHVTDTAFEKTVLESKLPVLVDFWAPWCGPCKMVAPTLDKLAKENAGNLLVTKVNTDENPEWAMKFQVQGIPTMLFGPALAGEPHGPAEHIMIDDMVACTAALAAFLADVLG